MSVIVKDMKMPKSCPCELVGVGYDVRCTFTYGVPSRVLEYYECCEKETRPDWCPLIEIATPHGRLVDADELSKKLTELADCKWNQVVKTVWSDAYEEVNGFVKDASTIIEAEGT